MGKQRNGPIGTVKMHFEAKYTRFDDLERDEAPEVISSRRTVRGVRRDL